MRQRKQARRRQSEPWEGLSFLFNCLSPWNWIIQRDGLMAGRAEHYLFCPVRSLWSLKIRGRLLFTRRSVPTTASGLQG